MLDKQIPILIEEITPLNNIYRTGIKDNWDGIKILKIMWDVGDILFNHGITKIHPIAWKIYGKEKGIRRSYITRDFISYCFRIRKYFENKKNIENEFPSLQRYSLFREAFPLLENPKYKLDGQEKADLIKLLNSRRPFPAIKMAITRLKKEKIQINNDRRQRLAEMAPLKDNFIDISRELSDLIKEHELQKVRSFRNKIGIEALQELSQLCLSLTQEGLSISKITQLQMVNSDEEWITFGLNLIRISNSDLEMRNRYRRVISASRLMEMAEMLNALCTDEGYSIYITKKEIPLKQ